MQCFTSKKKKENDNEEDGEELDVVKLRYLQYDIHEKKKYKPIRAFFSEFETSQSILQLDISDYTWLRVRYEELKEAAKTNDEKVWTQEMQDNKEKQHNEKVELDQLLKQMTKQFTKIKDMESIRDKKTEELENLKKNYLRVLIKNLAIKKELLQQQNKFADQVHLVLDQIQEANLYY